MFGGGDGLLFGGGGGLLFGGGGGLLFGGGVGDPSLQSGQPFSSQPHAILRPTLESVTVPLNPLLGGGMENTSVSVASDDVIESDYAH